MHLVLWHYWRSSCSHRVRIALELKGIAHDKHAVNLLAGEQLAQANVARSPLGTVPCLEIDGRPFSESIAVLELLEELFPEPALLPRDPWGRARVRQLVEIVNSGIQPLQNLAVLRKVSSDPDEQRAWARAWIERGLAGFESALARVEEEGLGGRYCVGDAPTLADVALVPQVHAARRFGADIDAHRRLLAAHEAMLALAAVQRAAPERQPDAPAPG
jgi:maleylacetoacetate isomerase